jgi:hypothetical protein
MEAVSVILSFSSALNYLSKENFRLLNGYCSTNVMTADLLKLSDLCTSFMRPWQVRISKAHENQTTKRHFVKATVNKKSIAEQ